jgi:nicotinamide-nucleotide amidase
MTTASICTIGDEILIGQIVDTNSSVISRELGAAGIRVKTMLSIGDDHDRIINCLRNELENNDIVITTGGLGPTKDDITKAALAELSGSRQNVEHPGQMEMVYKILHSRGLEVLDINRQQAVVPDTCEVIVNHLGTAPVMVFRFEASRFGHPATLYSLPGVPHEAIGALQDVVDDIKSHYRLESITHRTIMVYGMAESALAKKIEPWEDALPEDFHLAYLPNQLTGVRLRLSVYGGDEKENVARIESRFAVLKEMLGDMVYSDGDDTLQGAIGRLLRGSGRTLSAAESCT